MTAGGQREVRLPRLPGSGLAWAVGLCLGGLALLTVVTASTPVAVLSPPPADPGGAAPSSRPVTPPPPSPTPSVSGLPFDVNQLPQLPPVVVTLLQLVVGALVVWAIVALLRFAWRTFPRLRTRVVETHRVAALPDVPDELLDSAAARRALLEGGTPRNAIVACWVDLEDAASAAGLPRAPHETAAEYTVRVLRTWDIAPQAMGALAELYREARYSRHDLTESHRSDALRQLDAIHEGLQRVVDEARAREALAEAERAARFAEQAPTPGRDAP